MSQAQSIDAPAVAGKEISAGKSLLVVGLCWLAIFAEGYDVGVIGAILPALSVDPVWQLTPIELGAIGSYTVIGMLIGGILAGTLSELHGRKPLFVACITLFSLCMIVSAMAPSPFIFGLSRFISGIGLGGIIPVAAALTVEYSPIKKKSFNYGLMYSGYSMGLLAAALCGRGFLEAHGWRTIVLIGAIPLLFVPIFLAFLPESVESLVQRGKHDAARKTAARMGVGVPAAIVRKHGKVGWRTVFSEIFSPKKAFETACFWIALFMGLLLVYGLAQWLPQIMRKNGYDLGNSLLFLAVFSLKLGDWRYCIGHMGGSLWRAPHGCLLLCAGRAWHCGARLQGLADDELCVCRDCRFWHRVRVAGSHGLSCPAARFLDPFCRNRLGAELLAHWRAVGSASGRIDRKPQCRPAVELLYLCHRRRFGRCGNRADSVTLDGLSHEKADPHLRADRPIIQHTIKVRSYGYCAAFSARCRQRRDARLHQCLQTIATADHT